MLPENMLKWGKTRSCIRELMEYGAIRKKEVGADNVYDFSIGNPSTDAPESVKKAMLELLEEETSTSLHGYTTAAGLIELRETISKDLHERYKVDTRPELMYITCGAAAACTISLNAIVNSPEDEVLIVAPFFAEYTVFVRGAGAKPVVVHPDENFEIDIDDLRSKVNKHTIAIIIDTPNNPTGLIYSKENLLSAAEVLKEAEQEFNKTIYLISDEPYRELIYTEDKYINPLTIYDDSIMCYSFSKAMSLPGERIGYIALNAKLHNAGDVYAAICGAGRALGYVNAPSFMQKVLLKAYGTFSDFNTYKENRDALTSMLDELGYSYVSPDGAFYLFVKALENDAKAFSEKAKKYDLLLVPSDDFGVKGYVRVAYCVEKKTIINSYDAFKKLKEEYDHE